MSPVSDTRDSLLSAARALILTRSYAAVGVAEICAGAGVTKGSFYHFFDSKRDLTLAALDATYADLKRDLLDRAFDSSLAPIERLRRFVELNASFQTGLFEQTGFVPGCPFGNLAAEQATQDGALRDKVAALFARLRAELRAALVEAGMRGEIAPIDVAATASAMLAYFEGVILMAKTQNDPVVLKELLPAMLDIRIAAKTE